MAAEKLTKGRLAQILVMMIVLATAFIWRSVTHYNKEVLCTLESDCVVQIAEYQLNFVWNDTQQKYQIQVQPNDGEITIDMIQPNAELSYNSGQWTLHIDNIPARLKITKMTKGEVLIQYVNLR